MKVQIQEMVGLPLDTMKNNNEIENVTTIMKETIFGKIKSIMKQSLLKLKFAFLKKVYFKSSSLSSAQLRLIS